MTKGHCKHGEFELEKGCPQCIAEAQAEKYLAPGGRRPGKESTDTALIERPGADREILDFYHQACQLKEYADARVIKTLEDAESASDDLAVISKVKKAMEVKREEYLKPLREQTKATQESYKFLMEPVLAADLTTRNKLTDYNREQARIKAEQEEVNRLRIEAAQKEAALNGGEISEPVDLVEVVEATRKISTEMGTSGMTDCWKYEVVDFAALPDEYKVADTAMLNSIAKRHHDQKQIAGVRFFNEPVVTVRAR